MMRIQSQQPGFNTNKVNNSRIRSDAGYDSKQDIDRQTDVRKIKGVKKWN